jgi:hypothetical protein
VTKARERHGLSYRKEEGLERSKLVINDRRCLYVGLRDRLG